MKKKALIIIGILILLVFLGSLYYSRFYQKTSSDFLSPLISQKEESEAKFLVWEDPAGFKFSYPKEIKINNHPEDKENYAHLELTSDFHPGSILILMKDTSYKNIEDWVKKEVSTSSAQIFDTDLGGNPAKKVAFFDSQKLTTVTLDVDALVLVELAAQDSWWSSTYNQILESFEFIPLQGEEAPTPAKVSGSSGQTNGGGIIDEGEEIVE